MVDTIDGVLVTGNCELKSVCQMYIEFIEEKYGQKLKRIDIQINNEEDVADLRFEFNPWHYERVGKISLYL